MAYKVPVSPGTEDEGRWYVPIIGMGGGSIIGKGMESLKNTWAETLRVLGQLPTESKIASLTGGMNTVSKAMPAAKEAWTTISELEQMPLKQVEGITQRAREYGNAGGRAVRPQDFPTNGLSLSGGMIPRPDVMDRVMNSGLRDKLLGFGNK